MLSSNSETIQSKLAGFSMTIQVFPYRENATVKFKNFQWLCDNCKKSVDCKQSMTSTWNDVFGGTLNLTQSINQSTWNYHALLTTWNTITECKKLVSAELHTWAVARNAVVAEEHIDLLCALTTTHCCTVSQFHQSPTDRQITSSCTYR